MPRVILEPPVLVYCNPCSSVCHVSATCAGTALSMPLYRREVLRRLCKRCRRG